MNEELLTVTCIFVSKIYMGGTCKRSSHILL